MDAFADLQSSKDSTPTTPTPQVSEVTNMTPITKVEEVTPKLANEVLENDSEPKPDLNANTTTTSQDDAKPPTPTAVVENDVSSANEESAVTSANANSNGPVEPETNEVSTAEKGLDMPKLKYSYKDGEYWGQLIHSANAVTAGRDHCFCTCRPSVPTFQNKTNFKRKQCSLLERLWIFPNGSLMTPVLCTVLCVWWGSVWLSWQSQ